MSVIVIMTKNIPTESIHLYGYIYNSHGFTCSPDSARSLTDKPNEVCVKAVQRWLSKTWLLSECSGTVLSVGTTCHVKISTQASPLSVIYCIISVRSSFTLEVSGRGVTTACRNNTHAYRWSRGSGWASRSWESTGSFGSRWALLKNKRLGKKSHTAWITFIILWSM